MNNIKINIFLTIIFFNVFCADIHAQENEKQEQDFASQNENENLEKSERLKEYYEALGLVESADLEKVTSAYHNLAAQAHEIITSKKDVYEYRDDKYVVKLYCIRHVNKNKSATQDRLDYGYDYITVFDSDRDEVIAAREKLKKIREAYEAISGKQLEKIKKIKSELTIKGLDQKTLNTELRRFCKKNPDEGFISFLHTMQTIRKKHGLEEQQILDDDDFVLGEYNQDMSYLSIKDKTKAFNCLRLNESYLSEENKVKALALLKKNNPILQDLEPTQTSWNVVIYAGTITILSLIARAFFLQE